MNHVDELVRLQFHERDELLKKTRINGKPNKLSPSDLLRIEELLGKTDEIKSRRGRPRGSASLLAFDFVNTEMRVYRSRNNTKRVPARALELFVERAMKLHKGASEEAILEYLSRRRKKLPEESL